MKEKDNLKEESIKGFIWRTAQNVSTQVTGLVIQIILARILLPSEYGLVSLNSVIITILNVIVQTGFTSSIVQKKEITEIDKSSMFYFSISIGVIIYIIVFLCSPAVASFYNEPLLENVLRVQAISLIIISLCSVHNAIIMRNLDFKKNFIASLIGVFFQGFVGIGMALKGYGVWALVFGTLSLNVANCIALLIICKWRPKLLFAIKSIKGMVSFSSKILAGNLLNTIFNSSKTLVIGKVFNSEMVGYYNRGYVFPATMVTGIDGAMTTVLFSSLSRVQDDRSRFVNYLRKSMKTSLTIVTPLLCGMAAVSDPMIRFLLTDKWASAVPFVIISCVICLFWPLTAKNQALNAVGRSGTNLLLNILTKVVSLAMLFASIPFGVYVICFSSLIGDIISITIYTVIISKYCSYSIKQQIMDVIPIYALGGFMFICTYCLSSVLIINNFVKLCILIIFGAAIYVGVSYIFKMEGFMYILQLLRSKLKKASK